MDKVKDFEGVMFLLVLCLSLTATSAGKSWLKQHHDHSNHIDVGAHRSHLESLEVVCSRDHMTVHMHFDEPFYGMVFSHGGPRHERCVHVGPRAGIQDASFQIRYDSCGTVEDFGGRFHENTLVVQFGEDILEEWDEAKRLRCEWLENFEKAPSKPTLAIADLDVVELNFQGDDIDCWMEVQEGKGPWSRKVGGLVPIGSPLTLVIAINDHSREFDMRIKRCTAGDGTTTEIELTDHNGCVSRPSLLTPFAKVRDFGAKATLVAYAHLHAFKFPDKMDVFVHCIVEVCRHGCPDSCGHQIKEFFHPRRPSDSLEAKKHQKLVNLANSHPSGHYQPSTIADSYPLPGRERNKGILIPAAQHLVQQVVLKNASIIPTTSDTRKVIKYEQRATFKPKIKEQNLKEDAKKSPLQSSASNIQSVFTDIGNNLHSEHNSKLNSYVPHNNGGPQINKPVISPTYHRIIGHDAHWVSDVQKQFENHHVEHTVPDLKEISYLAPQPEPSAWSADELKHLTKQENFPSHQVPKPEINLSVHYLNSEDELKEHLPEIFNISPQPEPTAWSVDEVKSLIKQKNFHSHQIHKSAIDVSPINSQVPQPEPAPWTHEDVKPMHSPEVYRLKLHTRRPEETIPEPTTWTLDKVKPLSKEELRLISLNHKFKSNPHIDLPIYKEFVHPYSTSTIPQPIYISSYTVNPQNTTSSNMKMMMMPTLLPYTYQTALWPQRATTRFLKPHRHHYPYPIPQFSPQQQLMMSVVADRRVDENIEDLSREDSSAHHTVNSEDTKYLDDVHMDYAHNNETSAGAKLSDKSIEQKLTISNTEHAGEKKILIGETFHKSIIPESQDSNDSISNESFFEEVTVDSSEISKITTKDKLSQISATVGDQSTEAIARFDSSSIVRPPVSGFVPPSLDDIGTNPETKDRTAYGPRALDRRKRSSEPVFGVRQKFQAIAPSDLAFEWNLTSEGASVFRGRREEIVYGICMSPAGMSAGIGLILILTLLSIIASVVLYEHSCLLTKKTSHLSFITKNFNGQFEALYKITRPYLYSDNR